MRHFVFFGRLVEEKGFDLLFDAFDDILSGRTNASFSVFGDGPFMGEFFRRFGSRPGVSDLRKVPDRLVPGSVRSGPGIRIFGFRSGTIVREAVREADFSVVPSRFLETFGLSALESLSAGVPVACFDKGGLSQFLVASGLRIPDTRDGNGASADVAATISALAKSSDGLLREWKLSALRRARDFSTEAFDARVRAILPPAARKILLVTDFSGNLGGTETYVRNLESRLALLGYDVRIHAEPVRKWNLAYRAFTTLAAFCNVAARRKLDREIAEFEPDVVWCQSVLRRIGPVGIAPVVRTRAFKIVTYHDFGLLAPSASMLRREGDVPLPGFVRFLRKAPGFSRLPAILKYWKISRLFRSLRTFDVHLVPSEFMEPYVRSKLPPGSAVKTLPHFVP